MTKMSLLKNWKQGLWCRCMRMGGALVLALLPEFTLAVAQADPAVDITGHFGWSCWSAKSETASVRVQVSAHGGADGQDLERMFRLKVVAVPNNPDEAPVVITSLDSAREEQVADRVIYEGHTPSESVELRIHTGKRAEDGVISNLILERDQHVLDSSVPVVSVIQLECAETRLP